MAYQAAREAAVSNRLDQTAKSGVSDESSSMGYSQITARLSAAAHDDAAGRRHAGDNE